MAKARAALNSKQAPAPPPTPLPTRVSGPLRTRRRAKVMTLLLSLAFVGVGVRAAGLAVDDHEQLAARSRRQNQTQLRLSATRGPIFDRNGAALAIHSEVHRIQLNPRKIRKSNVTQAVKQALTPILKSERLLRRLDHHLSLDKAYRVLQHDLSKEERVAVEALKFPGLSITKAATRVYPRGRLASHVVGRVNRALEGTLGVEQSLEDRLRGHETASPALRARAHARSAKVKGLLVDGGLDPLLSRGHAVTLTIDSVIQDIAEQALTSLVERWHPVGASVIVLDPFTGEIMALANQPTFDPNHGAAHAQDVRNLAIQSAYEPGSTMKTFTVAAALEEGTVTPQSVFHCENGRWQYTRSAQLTDTHASGNLTVAQILAMSSNIGTTKIYETLGKERLHGWLKRFHFGQTPEIELPAPAAGLLADWRKWSDIQGANVSFGQGIAATPLQVASAFAVIANGGEYVAPSIIRSVTSADGTQTERRKVKRERVLSKKTAATMMRLLSGVVQERHGTGKNARVPGYRVAGKTSTAQKAGPSGYFEDQYYASFVGTLPAEKPRAVILVSVDNPEGGHYGNEVAAPTFALVASALMAHWDVDFGRR